MLKNIKLNEPSIIIYHYSLFQLRPPGYSCRPAENECDLSELCTGQSGECPADLFVKNLVECNQGQGYCFNGQCPTMRSQCKEVWGHKASPGDKACYQKFNMGGTQSGNCGTRPYSGGFKPCEIENIACGTLHCQEGSSKPRIPGRNEDFFHYCHNLDSSFGLKDGIFQARLFDQFGHQTTSAYIENKDFFAKSCHR